MEDIAFADAIDGLSLAESLPFSSVLPFSRLIA